MGNLDFSISITSAIHRSSFHDSRLHPNLVFYMAVRPSEFPAIIERLGVLGLLKEQKGWCRVVIEKPFGYDLLSAQTLLLSLISV